MSVWRYQRVTVLSKGGVGRGIRGAGRWRGGVARGCRRGHRCVYWSCDFEGYVEVTSGSKLCHCKYRHVMYMRDNIQRTREL
jgi:hypothetical protein